MFKVYQKKSNPMHNSLSNTKLVEWQKLLGILLDHELLVDHTELSSCASSLPLICQLGYFSRR